MANATAPDTGTAEVPRLAGLRQPKGFVQALPFLIPALAFYGVYIIYPMINAVYLSLHEWNGFAQSPMKFVGLSNFKYLYFRDPVFWTAFFNTFIWVGLSLVVPVLLGLIAALAVNQPLPGRNVFRTFFYLPQVLAPIAVGTMWRWIYNPNYGAVNDTLRRLGLENWTQLWLGDPNIALYSVFIGFVWTIMGVNMVLFLAGLQNVEQSLVDAARIDGAGSFRVFRAVTLPALRPAITIVIAMTIFNSLKVFDLIVSMTRGGPAQSTQVLALWSYTQSFDHHAFGVGNAIAVNLFVITMVIVIPYLRWSLKESH
jgi:raffinose/stachyose/melibiose transport system permease protein